MVPWIATYRLQLTPTFGFPEVERLLDYFARLGVSHLYLSPILEARSGSLHGYDGIDPRQVRREFGGEADFRHFAAAAHASGLGVLVDIVPNHLAVSTEGEPFCDVLERGEASPYHHWFDVDWDRGGPSRRVIVPWLKSGGVRNYRRYLDIDDLIGIRVEDPTVFDATHAKVLELAHDGLIDGLRIDHLDGLTGPVPYLTRLRSALPEAVRIFVETSEEFSHVGTTGYDALAAIDSTLLPDETAFEMEREYSRIVGDYNAADELKASVARVLDHELSAELEDVHSGLAPGAGQRRADTKFLLEFEILNLVRTGMRDAVVRADLTSSPRSRFVRYARSKAIEDTYLYRDRRVLARNELGRSQLPPGSNVPGWKSLEWFCEKRTQIDAESLTATSTHDTKRSEDARARLIELANRAHEFGPIVEASFREFERIGTGDVSRLDAWFLLQELIAIWPSESNDRTLSELVTRLEAHSEKAAREAKQKSTWATPNFAYEAKLRRFVQFCIHDETGPIEVAGDWRSKLRTLASGIANDSLRYSLAQLLLKCIVPGIPDFYQGCELVRPMLVDPDNRSPVDFPSRLAMLHGLERDANLTRSNRLARVVGAGDAARTKLFVTKEILRFREQWHDFLQKARTVVYPYRDVLGAGRPDAIIVRRTHGDREVCAVIALREPSALRAARALVIPGAVGFARVEWFSERVFATRAQHSMLDLVQPLGCALLVSTGALTHPIDSGSPDR